MVDRFPHFYQLDYTDCGPTSLRMVAKYFRKNNSPQNLRDHYYPDREGVSLQGNIEGAEQIGLRTLPVNLSIAGNNKKQAYLVNAPYPTLYNDCKMLCLFSPFNLQIGNKLHRFALQTGI